MEHPLIVTSPHRLGPRVGDDLFRRLCRSRDYLASQIDQPVRLADAAREAYLSPYHYHRVFQNTFGESPHEFVTRLRIERAKRLLLQEAMPVSEVCLSVGFESLGSFSTRFRSLVGYSPSEYQRSLRSMFQIPKIAPYRMVPNCFLAFYDVRRI